MKRQTSKFLLKYYDKVFGVEKSLEPDALILAQTEDPMKVGPFGAAMLASRAHCVAGLVELDMKVRFKIDQLQPGQEINLKQVEGEVKNPRLDRDDIKRCFARLISESRVLPLDDRSDADRVAGCRG